MLRAAIEEVQDWWDLLMPPVATPDEKIADALALAHDAKNDLMVERWKTRADLKRADAELLIDGSGYAAKALLDLTDSSVRPSIEATMYLSALQREQDHRRTWGEAFDYATVYVAALTEYVGEAS